jgi:iron complex outermembrane receptor protein
MKLKNGAALALVLTSSLSAAAISLPALAADTDENPADNELTEIVVTAEKRAENLQEVPIAVSAFTTKDRDLVGIETLQDLTNYTPGVTFNQADDRITIRGITRSTNNLGIEPGVPIYVDGFYRTFNNLVEDSPLSTSQVEILRGPQGTLFGRNAIGGAVSYTSARPTSDFEGEFRATVGNFEERSFEGAMGGPINDWLRFRVYAADFVQNEGWYQSIVSHNNDMLGLRDDQEYQLQLEGNAGQAFDWWAKADHRQWNEGFGNQVNISPYNLNNSGCTVTNAANGPLGAPDLVCPGVLGPNPTYSSFAGNTNPKGPPLSPAVPGLAQNITSPSNPYIQQDDTENRDFLNDWTYTLQANLHLGFADLKYIGGYDNYVYSLDTDADGTDRTQYTYAPSTGAKPVTIFTQEHTLYQEDKHFFSNELNLVSTGDGPFQYVLGFYDYHEHYNQPVSIGSNIPQPQLQHPISLATLAPGAPDPSGTPFAYNSADGGQSNALFGQVDWSVDPQFKVEAGLRYTKDQKSSDEQIREIFWDPTFGGAATPSVDITQLLAGDVVTVNGKQVSGDGVNLTPTAQGYLTRHLDISSDGLTGTAGVNWLPNKETLVYLSYTRGYKEAGLNTGTLVQFPYVQPEHIDAYEAGLKETLFNRLQLNSSLFYYKYLGSQIPLALTNAIVPTVAFFNINQINYGAEFESIWQATDNLRFLLSYGYLHARFEGQGLFSNAFDVNPATGQTGNPEPIDGNRVPGAPDNKVSLNTIYTWRFSSGALSASGSYLWRSGSTSTPFNNPQLFAPSYGQADFRATWTSTSHYQIVGYIRNAFGVVGKDAIVGGEYIGNGYGAGINNSLSWQLIPPRTYGVEARYRFGDNPR